MFGSVKPNMRGVTLIMVAGVLAVLAAMAAGFYTLVTSQSKSSVGYSDTVHAEFMARAGINDAVARLRDSASRKIEDPSDAWYAVDYLHGAAKRVSFAQPDYKNKDASGQPRPMSFSRSIQNSANEANSDSFTLDVSDSSSKININAGDNLAVLLDNLCRAIGPPLVAANLDALQPRRWAAEGASAAYFATAKNVNDKLNQGSVCFMPTKGADKLFIDGTQPPVTDVDGSALYGDGYAIARYRAVKGRFNRIDDVKSALTFKPNPGHADLEALERELKFEALKDYITVDSWIDSTTVCVGKFEWINGDIAIDRDKSWIEDDPVNDPKNQRGSLRGSYVSIVNGHGAGQLRRIETNGADWIKIKPSWTLAGAGPSSGSGGKPLLPGPISSYMIVAQEDALTDSITDAKGNKIDLPRTDANGALIDDPDIDYERYPLCIHRAPVNINTASDKVLTAMFLGINVSHGHYMAIGTDVDVDKTYDDWYTNDPNKIESRLSTLHGLKRLPINSGALVYDKSLNALKARLGGAGYNVDYLNNFGALYGSDKISEAHELALRIIVARQLKFDGASGTFKPAVDPISSTLPRGKGMHNVTGPFKSWDDFYFRVVRPWDEDRIADEGLQPDARAKRGPAAQMIMAHFNPNTDMLKFNPGIEWIDRWGRNFSELEPVMSYSGGAPIYLADIKTYVTRNLRYKADELIDKTDMNRSTTEFCFDSGGIFEIRSTGRVSKNGNVLAERKFEALVQIYGVWRETTQRQFVNGEISEADNPTLKTGALETFTRSGKVARDGKNHNNRRLALDTLPEPLVPLNYKLNDAGRNADVVDLEAPTGRDCFGNKKSIPGQPDVLANRILPAGYDGQIVLATNTSRYDEGGEEMDTFLASYNGDLDTDTSVGNGREQSKSPADRKTRVLDTISLMGVLNDTDPNHVDFDMQDGRAGDYKTFRINEISAQLKPLDPSVYTDCVTCRMGDLRSEGVWLGYVGVSGNDGTLKYLMDVNGYHPAEKRKNWNPEDGPGAKNGGTVSMWIKPAWHADDNHDHEFFSATNPGNDAAARYDRILKGAGTQSDNLGNNNLTCSFEDQSDGDCGTWLYGSTRNAVDPSARNANKPAFRTQPFRWSMVGGVIKYNEPIATTTIDFQGYKWPNGNRPYGGPGENDPRNIAILTKICRPFISLSVNPEGSRWSPAFYWSRLWTTPYTANTPQSQYRCDLGSNKGFNQQAAWDWADGGAVKSGNKLADQAVFGANNLNKTPTMWLYRETPIDGTMAVIDELKLTKNFWDTNLIAATMCTSRYYLPKNPSLKTSCPAFTSQSLLQSLKGAATLASDLKVRPIRIAWTGFTPRFMHEMIQPSTYNPVGNYAQGPFNYEKYNYEFLNPGKDSDPNDRYGVVRPTLVDYQNRNPGKPAHASSGLELELLNAGTPIAGLTESTPGKLTPTSTFTNPEVFNSFPTNTPEVKAQDLKYRVRFVYPIDPFFGGGSVDPSKHYLLDTPVFDDVSITYSITPRILDFREVRE